MRADIACLVRIQFYFAWQEGRFPVALTRPRNTLLSFPQFPR